MTISTIESFMRRILYHTFFRFNYRLKSSFFMYVYCPLPLIWLGITRNLTSIDIKLEAKPSCLGWNYFIQKISLVWDLWRKSLVIQDYNKRNLNSNGPCNILSKLAYISTYRYNTMVSVVYSQFYCLSIVN